MMLQLTGLTGFRKNQEIGGALRPLGRTNRSGKKGSAVFKYDIMGKQEFSIAVGVGTMLK